MTLKETLAALDAKATKGEWLIRKVGHDHIQVHNGIEHEVLSTPRAMNAAFIVALVKLYRTGQLVVAPSVPSMEEVAADIACNSPTGLQYPWHTDAARAILASMGAKTDA